MATQSKIIGNDTQTDARAWQMPNVGGAEPVTANGLQGLQKSAYDEAYEEGKAAGFEYGHREGLESGRGALTQRLKFLDGLLSTLDTPLADLDDQIENELTTLAIAIAKHLIRRELKIDPAQVVGVVRETVKLLPVTARNICLHLHPSDAELVRELLEVHDTDLGWRIEEDPIVARGGLLVNTDSSFIDASVENRIASVASSLLGGDRSEDKELSVSDDAETDQS
ncbi:MAG TPA: flagellar assembly protein FliH [Chromatiales bacterium]|jgi:flagellar assembly protein FliH|nr:flagellar assembly protein FliH [Chromatiales bacterium]